MNTVGSPSHRWESETSNRVEEGLPREWSWLAGQRSEEAFSEAGLASRTVAAGGGKELCGTLCDQEAAKSRTYM